MLSEDTNLRWPKSSRSHCGALWVGSLDQRVSLRKSIAEAALKWPLFCSLEAVAAAMASGCSAHEANLALAESTVSSEESVDAAHAGKKANTLASEITAEP
jgi:hypothetical protein